MTADILEFKTRLQKTCVDMKLNGLLEEMHWKPEELEFDNGWYYLPINDGNELCIGETKDDVIYFLEEELKLKRSPL